jgi:2-C-methyl-D-erythritol 4-phosphate cytidylyltransferase
MKKYVLIVAGGSGKRMKSGEPKQFMPLGGKPVLMLTMMQFYRYDPLLSFVLVLPQSHHDYWKQLCDDHGFGIPHLLVAGGETRFGSVRNGLSAIPEEGIVFIHDGVRPLVSLETLRRCEDMACKAGNAIPVIPVTESVRQLEGNLNFPVNRENFVLIQTPQTFRVSLIQKAYQQEYSPEFTDDATVVEKTGVAIRLVEGNRENIKITWPEDLLIAGALSGNFQ